MAALPWAREAEEDKIGLMRSNLLPRAVDNSEEGGGG